MKRKDYIRPMVKAVILHQRATLLSGSGDLRGSGRLGKAWENNSKDAWDGSSPSGGGNSMGGWSDKGGSAWE
jgi:hypothetical protein